MRWSWILGVVWAMACAGPDEVTCEVRVAGVDICIDGTSQSFCKKDLGGEASNAEVEPGGPYEYCEDLYPVSCPGSVVFEGDNYTANNPFYAGSEEDCAKADGQVVGG